MPVSAGRARRGRVNASRPPADAPIPTIGNGRLACPGLSSSTNGSWGGWRDSDFLGGAFRPFGFLAALPADPSIGESVAVVGGGDVVGRTGGGGGKWALQWNGKIWW